MAEKGETKIIAILTISIMLVSIGLSGCVEEEKDEDINPPNYPTPPYWNLEMIKMNPMSNNLISNDLQFEIKKDNKVIINTNISMANPKSIIKGMSKIYPISTNSSPVMDESSGEIVNSESSFSDYTNCCILYLDQTQDNKINGGDSVYIYRDWDRDGKSEIISGSIFTIYDKNMEIIFQKNLEKR
jgi:hypothetical protein